LKPFRIAILGSTGSIGRSALSVIKSLKKNNFPAEVVFLSANENIETLYSQVKEFKPEYVYINSRTKKEEFCKYKLPSGIKAFSDEEDLNNIIDNGNFDLFIVSVVGFSGLKPTIRAIKAGKRIAMANKETLVVAGSVIKPLLKKYNSELIPIDSEHSAILQCIKGEEKNSVSKIILTASGGPFRTKSLRELKNASVKDALNHPNWNMGNKITIDSATMMNKGLEVIEAKWLFDIETDNIEVLIHPQSIVHSMVEFNDGSIKAQLGIPDMKIPIQYAITYPERVKSDYPKLNFYKQNFLSFEKPDFEKFQCLKLAFQSIKDGGLYPTVLNAANEVAVDLFLNNRIKFLQIPEIIKRQLDKFKNAGKRELEQIYETDRNTRKDILRSFN
jgi:1-deoxy-D-xylulose-5-phosphate reductoisomerase